jgi:hypothetical protein
VIDASKIVTGHILPIVGKVETLTFVAGRVPARPLRRDPSPGSKRKPLETASQFGFEQHQ